MPDEHLDSLSVEKRAEHHRTYIGKSGYMVAEESGVIVGFICCGQDRSDNSPTRGEIYAIYLLDKAKGKGVGENLMRAAAEWLMENNFQEISLWVAAENICAKTFYKTLEGITGEGSKTINIGGKDIAEIQYVWKNPKATRLIHPKQPLKNTI